MESHQANQQFKAIRKWQARHQSSVQREGGFLMFSQKKMASVKAQMPAGESKNGRNPATLQVTWKQLNWPSPFLVFNEVAEFSDFCCSDVFQGLLKQVIFWRDCMSAVRVMKLRFIYYCLKSVGHRARTEAKNWGKTGFRKQPIEVFLCVLHRIEVLSQPCLLFQKVSLCILVRHGTNIYGFYQRMNIWPHAFTVLLSLWTCPVVMWTVCIKLQIEGIGIN